MEVRRKMATEQNELGVKISTNVDEANKKLDKLLGLLDKGANKTDKFSKSADNIKRAFNFGATIQTARKFFDLFNKGIDNINKYSETLNMFHLVMGDLTTQADKFQNTMAEAFGNNTADQLEFQSYFQSLTESMGLQEKYAYIISENMSKLTYDLSSLFDKEQKDVATALRAGLVGQTKPVRNFGMDITENSLVALYFACCSKPDKDGEVFVFKHDERYVATYPVINGIAESYKFSFCTINSIEAFYDDIKNQSYFLEQKNTNEICNKTSKDGANWIVECCKNPFFIYAPIRSDRQKAQAGRYILFHNRISSRTNELYFENVIDPIDKNDEIIVKRIIIPKENKNQILEQLSLMGIAEDTLFSDSVDKVCKGIVNRCKKKIK